MKKKQFKTTLYAATDDIIDAYSVREFELGGEMPKRIGANELLVNVGGETFLIKVTRRENPKSN